MIALLRVQKYAGFGDSSLANKGIHRTRNHARHMRWREQPTRPQSSG